jgi:hypothetical protein
MSLLLNLFLRITQREFNNEYMRLLNLRHSDTLLVCVFLTLAKQLLFFFLSSKG